MSFLAPLYLLALLPFVALAVWMLVGRRRRQWVPFLALWDAPEEIRRPKKGLEPPPIALVLTLVALLLGILAAAGPEIHPSGTGRGRVSVIIDRGASMSALTDGKSRLASLAESAGPVLLEKFGPGDVDMIDAIDGSSSRSSRADWFRQTVRWKRTALITTDAVRATALRSLEQGQPTFILSDQELSLPANDQLVQLKPSTLVNNAGIISLAARPGQIMVRVRSSAATSRTITLRSGANTAQAKVELQAGQTRDVFIDFSATGDVIEAQLEGADDFEADDRAWIVRSRAWPIVEARSALPDELARMIEIYARHRPTGEASRRIAVARPGELKTDEAGIVVAPGQGDAGAGGPITRGEHPILAGVDLAPLERSVALAERTPGEGWNIIASQRGKPILAVRDGETRQVWIGFDSPALARSPSFVVFWTNVFDWAGTGGEGFSSGGVDLQLGGAKRLSSEKLSDDIDARYWPGLFESATGKFAANAPSPGFSTGATDWQGALSQMKAGAGENIALVPWLAMLGLACLLGAAATWEKRRIATATAAAHLDVETIRHVQTVFAADSHVHRHESETRPS